MQLPRLKQIPPEQRQTLRVRDVAVPLLRCTTVAPDDLLQHVLEKLRPGSGLPILVIDGQYLTGVITARDISRISSTTHCAEEGVGNGRSLEEQARKPGAQRRPMWMCRRRWRAGLRRRSIGRTAFPRPGRPVDATGERLRRVHGQHRVTPTALPVARGDRFAVDRQLGLADQQSCRHLRAGGETRKLHRDEQRHSEDHSRYHDHAPRSATEEGSLKTAADQTCWQTDADPLCRSSAILCRRPGSVRR
ncbi:CBS domain-containing protein [Streptomyces sp. NPDC057438]|uniref:CBS domain-containing protein n=1 Tax=Streptomyces sp. NPDC057438 TaxID=3346133 RepID=UPI003693AE60